MQVVGVVGELHNVWGWGWWVGGVEGGVVGNCGGPCLGPNQTGKWGQGGGRGGVGWVGVGCVGWGPTKLNLKLNLSGGVGKNKLSQSVHYSMYVCGVFSSLRLGPNLFVCLSQVGVG